MAGEWEKEENTNMECLFYGGVEGRVGKIKSYLAPRERRLARHYSDNSRAYSIQGTQFRIQYFLTIVFCIPLLLDVTEYLHWELHLKIYRSTRIFSRIGSLYLQDYYGFHQGIQI